MLSVDRHGPGSMQYTQSNDMRRIDIGTARRVLSAHLLPHNMYHVSSNNDHQSIAIEHRDLDQISFNRVIYDERIKVESPQFRNFNTLMIIRSGEVSARHGAASFSAKAGDVVLFSGKARSIFEFSAEFEQMTLKIPTSIIDAVAGNHNFSAHLRPGVLRCDTNPLLQAIESIYASIGQPNDIYRSRVVRKEAERLIAAMVIAACGDAGQPAEASDFPPSLVRACAFIERNLGGEVSIEDLCRVASISASGLNYIFKRYLGFSPLRYLALCRLEAANEMILRYPARQITEIALDCGFLHLSRFSGLYAKRFGELPSQTRNRALGALYRPN
ncbi:helix-turn-helix- domain containing protein, AraC type [Rhizorhabdus wittichii RW1]|uniref:Helix-turn-helix-domain containing protein, AraC type n=1 Tax=Rhizorhabdus wittichii (strain DSM 6014 / CCUG 31198 / JCM 15750 / NBRC 105917 / EY 4224 / RW1) TaxID=392499 RepID=A0A9J9LEA1_RHIWR|nr:helix-turn-helix- domain containing protein, AraC type [Rhizorhabdus wittichii RW1]